MNQTTKCIPLFQSSFSACSSLAKHRPGGQRRSVQLSPTRPRRRASAVLRRERQTLRLWSFALAKTGVDLLIAARAAHSISRHCHGVVLPKAARVDGDNQASRDQCVRQEAKVRPVTPTRHWNQHRPMTFRANRRLRLIQDKEILECHSEPSFSSSW